MDAWDVILIVTVCGLFCVCVTLCAIVGCILQQLCCIGTIAVGHKIWEQMNVKYYGSDPNEEKEFHDV